MVETNPQNPKSEGQKEPTGQPGQAEAKQLAVPVEGFDLGSFLVTVFVVSLLATAALFGYRYLLLARTLSEQQQQIAQLESELADPTLQALDKQVQEIAGGIDKIRPVLEDPIRYAELFWTLRKITEKGVRWTSLGFNEAQQLSLSGEAVGWGQIAQQLAALKVDERFQRPELTSATLETTEGGALVRFAITADVDTSKLVPPATAP